MKRPVILNQDILAGGLFAAFGIFLLFFGRNYSMGTLVRIGPGFMPTLVGWLLIGVAVVHFLKGLLRGGPGLERWALKPLIVLSVSFFAFAFMIEELGLVLTGMAVMLLATLAGHEFKPRTQIAVIIAAPVVASIVFIYLLGVPMRYWPSP